VTWQTLECGEHVVKRSTHGLVEVVPYEMVLAPATKVVSYGLSPDTCVAVGTSSLMASSKVDLPLLLSPYRNGTLHCFCSARE
jgi:hypothetical protein